VKRRDKPGFTENWWPIGKRERTVAALNLARPVLGDGTCIEIGCWEGRSTCVLAREVHPYVLHAVDHFKGDLTRTHNRIAERAAERDIEANFQLNVDAFTDGNVELHAVDWRVFAEGYNLGPIAFLHLDGEHTYEQVFDQIAWALDEGIVQGGVIVGDDYVSPRVRRAVRECLPEHQANGSTWWWQA
jgi:hypothetical protein